VTAFVSSILGGVIIVAGVLFMARRRPPGQPLTWGEAFVAGAWVFFGFILAYGLIPHYWLNWADSELSWRQDKTGIPLGPLGAFWDGKKGEALFFIPVNEGVAWPQGITFMGRGRIMLNSEHIRDVVAATIYIVMMAAQFMLWSFWQKRGKVAKQRAEREALTTSAYGRPLQKAQA
jgi:hypothetical protein